MDVIKSIELVNSGACGDFKKFCIKKIPKELMWEKNVEWVNRATNYARMKEEVEQTPEFESKKSKFRTFGNIGVRYNCKMPS
ncbi:MAG TPA: hypothetical protein VFI06_13670 [Chitinophagaceae bacterium]|nr:hypothetical protein [Chitinophagaceae bacterium]